MENPTLHHHHFDSCCHALHGMDHHVADKPSKMDKIIRVLEKVCLVAIGIFTAMTSPELFAVSFTIGLGIGIWNHEKAKEEAPDQDHALCAHGFIEHLTGIKLPQPLGLAANVAILVAHIDHHAPVFVPIVGVSLGIWAGREMEHSASLCFRKITAMAQYLQSRYAKHFLFAKGFHS